MLNTAKVAVSGAAYHFDKLYSYEIPQGLAPFVQPGALVLVPFGRGAKPRIGAVLSVGQEEAFEGLKPILDAAREEITLKGELLELVHFLKEETFCTYYDAVKAIVPYGALYKAKGNTLVKQMPGMEQVCYSYNETQSKLTPKQEQVYIYLRGAGGPCTFGEINAATGAGRSVVKTLIEKGGARAGQRSRMPQGYAAPSVQNEEEIKLSSEQEKVFTGLLEMLGSENPGTALLHGVTASGKTLVFLKLVQEVVNRGQKALVLVPEISLTPQMVRRFTAAFGERVAVQHSALSNGERLWQWQQIAQGKADVVVGTRSGVFAPIEDIGIIIIDEEQEAAYRSQSSPRYNALPVAQHRAKQHGALVLLASATPQITSYYAAQSGRYKLFELTQRYSGRPLPAVELIDMQRETKSGNTGQVSRRLAQEIAENLAHEKQTILLLNRRGYNRVATCEECGQVHRCSFCSVPMVHHKNSNKLMCHYCGYTISPAPTTCIACEGALRYKGAGTQKVEEELGALFPSARILRMDADSVQRKNAREEMLAAFAAGKYDIMLGTQMVAKGLDFDGVTLVGVLGIDPLLYSQNFRAYERTFSLVTQVVGRGGRSHDVGRAIVQTNDVGNHVLHLAAMQNYKQFYAEEIAFRKLTLYPPFCAMCVVGFQDKDEEKCLGAANRFLEITTAVFSKMPLEPLRALGPAPYMVPIVSERYRYRVTLKCRPGKAFRDALTKVLQELAKDKEFTNVSITIDFNQEEL